MLNNVSPSVFVHQSELLQNNTIVVQGTSGVLVVDPGITDSEMACLVSDLRELGQPVVAGFSTHPDWDHVLWHPDLGDAPRYATAGGAAFMRDLLAKPDWMSQARDGLPPEIADEMSLAGFGLLTGLPAGTTEIPWDGPRVRIVEHPAHAVGHAALLLEEQRVLVAGDMLSDILMPFPDLEVADPVGVYLAGLDVLEGVAGEVDIVIPGHGSVGRDIRERIALDREYMLALRDGRTPDDPRLSPDAAYGADWMPGVYEWQAKSLAT